MFFEQLIDKIYNKQRINETEIEIVCKKVIEIFINEPNVPFITSPVCILGDIHGQFTDLCCLFKLKDTPDKIKYIFLGDYVDRGPESLNVIMLLFCYKILYPENVCLIRGNHEQRVINKIYGFYDEIIHLYQDDYIWDLINDVFNYLSIAAIVDFKYFCVHGGISNKITLDKIKRIDRTMVIANEDILNDLFWSDPYNQLGCQPNQRGSGVLFGSDILKAFLIHNNLDMIIRSHQLILTGYKFDHNDRCLTIWSAPNYMDKIENPGCILCIEPNVPITPSSILIYKKVKKIK